MKKSLAELVFIPLPFWSHLNPAIEVAKLLIKHDHRLSITMLLMKSPTMDSKLDSHIESLASSKSDRLNFIILPCHYPSSQTTTMTSFVEHQKPHVKNFVSKLIDSTRLAGFVVDLVCTSMMEVAKEFGIPYYVLSTASSASASLMFHLQALYDECNIDFAELKNNRDGELVLPSFMNPVPIRVLPDMMLDKAEFSLFINYFRSTREAKGIIINTFVELESHVLRSLFDDKRLPPVYTVGPIVNLPSDVGSGGENNDSDEMIKWLDDQPPSSVVFLCFGNLGTFSEGQVKEIACALENSGIRFLWSLRQRPSDGKNSITPSSYTDSTDVLPYGFLNRTAEIGKVIGWAPQAAILAHRAIGGFVSHCGWNSTLESLWFGVPVATWPLYSEQQFNAFELVKELGLAVEIKLDYVMDSMDQTVVSAREIEMGIRKVMEHDSNVRKRVQEISEKGRKALMDGGSSFISLSRLINDVIENIS
ncbi:anthocyanidin 3-O-glucosyltransferase 6 [Ziziphus jujuba]|uniref:Glycosyltransferase n=1 Tax=Ziziphus jujuba TaxID=326968 RepID=A0A6P4APP9_ZIZJJ|nr:anthocyanidin 3-O-glucosyltransferase 6 [Ziziphus jujuba]WFR85805.1 OGT6 [Ziziphus jujuba var. spinosa]